MQYLYNMLKDINLMKTVPSDVIKLLLNCIRCIAFPIPRHPEIS